MVNSRVHSLDCNFRGYLICHKTVISDSFGCLRWDLTDRFIHYFKSNYTQENMPNSSRLLIYTSKDIPSKNNQF